MNKHKALLPNSVYLGFYILGMEPERASNGGAVYRLRCPCGNLFTSALNEMKRRESKACRACTPPASKLKADAKKKTLEDFVAQHYLSLTGRSLDNGGKTYGYWIARFNGMVDRCTDSSNPKFPRYGGRGIKIQSELLDPCFYAAYMQSLLDAADLKGDFLVDRINNDGHYEIGNLRLSDAKVSSRNRSSKSEVTYQGKKVLICELAELTGLKSTTIHQRIRYGWPEDRLAEPARPIKKWK